MASLRAELATLLLRMEEGELQKDQFVREVRKFRVCIYLIPLPKEISPISGVSRRTWVSAINRFRMRDDPRGSYGPPSDAYEPHTKSRHFPPAFSHSIFTPT